jgi:hypothetical protein
MAARCKSIRTHELNPNAVKIGIRLTEGQGKIGEAIVIRRSGCDDGRGDRKVA